MAIIDQLQPIGLLYKNGRHEDCLHQLQLLWNQCPTPREQDGNTFLILLYFTKILRQLERFEDAMEWALKGILYNGTRNLAVPEMLIGQSIGSAPTNKHWETDGWAFDLRRGHCGTPIVRRLAMSLGNWETAACWFNP